SKSSSQKKRGPTLMPNPKENAGEISSPKLPGFAPAIAKLLALGVPAKRLAQRFATTSSNIYVLAHRARTLNSSPSLAEMLRVNAASLELVRSAESSRRALKVREEEIWSELKPRKKEKLERLQEKMDEIVRWGRSSYQFLETIRRLRTLKSFIGYPSDSGLLKLSAKLHQHLAWFYVHSGYTTSSIKEAAYSAKLYEL